MKFAIACVRLATLSLFIGFWYVGWPYADISDFVGKTFPWPRGSQALAVFSLAVEGALCVCAFAIPAALLILAVFERRAPTVTLILSLAFAHSNVVSMENASWQTKYVVYAIYLFTLHGVILNCMVRKRKLFDFAPA